MNPFYGRGKRRAVQSEIRGAIEALTGSTPTYGFLEMLDAGDAVLNTDRLGGFREIADRREWILTLSSKRGMLWKTDIVPPDSTDSVLFVLSIGFGNGSPLPQPTGAWQLAVNGHPAVTIRGVNHSQRWRADECWFAFAANRIESAPPYASLCLSSVIKDESTAAFGPALLRVPASWLERGKPAAISVEPVADIPSTRWLQLQPCADMLLTTDIWAAVEVLAGDRGSGASDVQVFFGDIHTHSGQVLDECDNLGCGMGSRRDNYEYAREPGGLDFYALTDHEWQIDPHRVDEYLSLADTYNDDGRFVCLPGFEYTNLLYGHRNVYFRDSGGIVFNTNTDWGRPTLDASKCNSPQDLWDALGKNGVPSITVPHHPSATSHPLNLDFHDPRYDRLYEIYSCWGSSEFSGDWPRGVSDRFQSGHYQDALRRGQRYGVLASSDGHDGHPGNSQSPWVKHHHLFHFCGSGLAAVQAPGLTRAAVFDALYARRCYATTGVPIILDLTVCDAVMGSELPALAPGRSPQIRISCTGANGLDHLRIVKNGRTVHSFPCFGERSFHGEWEDRSYDPEGVVSYYVRAVQVDRESAWSSPVWIG